MSINKIILIGIAVLSVAYYKYEKQKQAQLIDCLIDKKPIIYGTYTCKYTTALRNNFGKYMQQFPFVDCDKQKELCIKNNITGYPSVTLEKGINREYVISPQGPDTLSKYTDCAPIGQRYRIKSGPKRTDKYNPEAGSHYSIQQE